MDDRSPTGRDAQWPSIERRRTRRSHPKPRTLTDKDCERVKARFTKLARFVITWAGSSGCGATSAGQHGTGVRRHFFPATHILPQVLSGGSLKRLHGDILDGGISVI